MQRLLLALACLAAVLPACAAYGSINITDIPCNSKAVPVFFYTTNSTGGTQWLYVGPVTYQGGDSLNGYYMTTNLQPALIVNGTATDRVGNTSEIATNTFLVVCADYNYQLSAEGTYYTGCGFFKNSLATVLSSITGYKITNGVLDFVLDYQVTPKFRCTYTYMDQIPELTYGCTPIPQSKLKLKGGSSAAASALPSLAVMLAAVIAVLVASF